MSNWIEVKERNDRFDNTELSEYLLNLDNVSFITIDCDYDFHYLLFRASDGTEFEKHCSSELEAQMLYAKLKKMLCKNEELNEIL